MTRRTLLTAPAALLVLLPLAGAVPDRPEPSGGPWISMEIPANPMDPATEGATFVIRAYYHAQPARFQPAGTAHGILDGQRVTVPLTVRRTSHSGVYAVTGDWSQKGIWLVTVKLQNVEGPVLLAELVPGNVVGAGSTPSAARGPAVGAIRVVNGEPSAAGIDAALRAMAARYGD